MGPDNLSALPIELFGAVVSFVSLEDVGSLRLTCRSIAAKATQGKFITALRQREIYLTTKTLQSLADVVKDSKFMATQLRTCTLTGMVDDSSKSRSEGRVTRSVVSGVQHGETDARHTRLLLEAFGHLKRHLGDGRLASLRLRVVIRTKKGTLVAPGYANYPTAHLWETTWATARRVFRVATAALAQAGLRVDGELDLFHGQVFCSLTCDLFAVSVGTYPWPAVFGSLKSIKANVSAPIKDYKAEASPPAERSKSKEWSAMYSIAGDGRATARARQTLSHQSSHKFMQSLIDLLCMLPELQDVDLCWREVETARDRHERERRPLPPPATPPFAAPSNGAGGRPRHLSSCTLSGFRMSAAGLVQFLRMTEPSSLTMRYIHVQPGTVADMLCFITDRDTAISSFVLDDLFEGDDDALVHFNIPGPPKFDYTGEKGTPSTLSRRGEEAKRAIRYHLPTTEAETSGAHWHWRHKTNRLYGPCAEL